MSNKIQSHVFKRTIFDSLLFAYLISIFAGAVICFTTSITVSDLLLKLNQNVTIFALGVVAGALLSLALNQKKWKTLGGILFASAQREDLEENQSGSALSSFWFWQLLVFLILTFAVGSLLTKVSISEILDPDGFQGAMRLFQGLATPNWEILPRAVANIIETIFMAFMATALAIPIAFVLSFFCAKNIMTSPTGVVVYLILRTLLNITRSIEALIWAIIFSVWVGIGPFAGMLALWIHSIASLAKQYSEIVETVSEGPIEGIQSTGANRLQTIWFAVVPQVILPFISFTVYRWDINIRMATIIGLVGGGGIGTLLIMYQGQAMWHEVGTIIVVIAFVVWAMDTASAHLREALK